MIGDFLSHYSNFSFNLTTHIRAKRFADSLLKVVERSAGFFCGDCSCSLTSEEVLEYLKSPIGDIKVPLRWEEIPFTTRDSLRQSLTLLPNHLRLSGAVKETSGTTSAPLPVLYSEFFDCLDAVAISPWFLAAAKLHSDHRPVRVLAIKNGRQRNVVALEPWLGGGMILKVGVDERDPESFRRLMLLMEELNPEILISKPTIFEALLLNLYKRRPQKVFPQLLVSSGQIIDSQKRLELSAMLNAPLLDVYATTELGLAGYRCSTCHKFHFDNSKCLIEVDNDRVLATMVLNNLMPIIKYHVEDICLSADQCTSGLPGFDLLSAKPSQFIPLQGCIGIDIGRFQIGRSLNSVVSSINTVVLNNKIDIRIKIIGPATPTQQSIIKLQQTICSLLPTPFSAIVSIESPLP